MESINKYLQSHRLLADGAFGTYYAQITGKHKAAEYANLNEPKLVKEIHKEYIQAGARLIRTNTFAANSVILGADKEQQKRILEEGYRLAAEAVKESGEQVYVAASIGPVPENLSDDHRDILQEYQFICDTFLACGADIILFETFSDIKYMELLSNYIKEHAQATVMVQFCLNRYGYTKTGIRASRLLERINQVDSIDIVGFNCGIGSGHMYEVLKSMKPVTGKPLIIMPNSSYPELLQDRAVYLENAAYFAKRMEDIAKLGIDILGGCCGTNPDYIRAANEQIDWEKPAKKRGIVTEKKEEQDVQAQNNEFYQKLMSGKKVIAVELDPPYDADFDGIVERAHSLKAMGVDMLTFADSPMARPRMDSMLTGVKVLSEVDIPVMPHISCRDKNMIAMRAQLLGGYTNGIRNLLLVTGDPIPGSDRGMISSVFDFNSIRLMEFVKAMNEEHFRKEPFVYGGAVNYARANIDVEIARMQKKIHAGASYFLTQPVFSDEDIERIRYIKEKVDTKILCGIMPLVNYKNARFIQNEITGIHVPEEVAAAFSPDMTREQAQKVGVAIAKGIMEKLEPIVDGFYFMLPFNRVSLVEECLK